jgi:hypothetical protein
MQHQQCSRVIYLAFSFARGHKSALASRAPATHPCSSEFIRG